MVEVSAETELFSSESDGRAVVFFTAKRNHDHRGAPARESAAALAAALDRWARSGWRTSVAAMFDDVNVPTVYETGFAHDVDIVGAFEAPSLSDAYSGVVQLQSLGWDELFSTEWTIGPREFRPVPSSIGRDADAPWTFFALWEWNDAWQAASRAERAEYDRECDIAFAADTGSGVSIAGRHRLDVQSSWHHLGIWEAPSFDHITRGMLKHEEVADFKYTTSRHYIGRRRRAADYFGEIR
jgi:hypothetical protein